VRVRKQQQIYQGQLETKLETVICVYFR